jgi:hypothetical protein
MSMKIEIIVTVAKKDTGLHLLACSDHQDMLVNEVNILLAHLVRDGVGELGVPQYATVRTDDLQYDESMFPKRPRSAEGLLETLKEAAESVGGVVTVLEVNDDSGLADVPDSAFMKPHSA